MGYESAWIINPFELINENKTLDIFPSNLSFTGSDANQTLNSLTRFFIYYGLLIGMCTRKYKNSMTNTLIVISILVIIYLYFNKNSREKDHRYIQNGRSESQMTAPMKFKENQTATPTPIVNNFNTHKSEFARSEATAPSAINQVPETEFNSVLNNPFMNPLIYSNCNTPFKMTLSPDGDIGQRPLVNNVMGEKPNENSLFSFEMGMLGETENIQRTQGSNRNILEKQQINGKFRQFYTLPVNGCINDQKSFAESLYGNPDDKIFKQLNIESKFTK